MLIRTLRVIWKILNPYEIVITCGKLINDIICAEEYLIKEFNNNEEWGEISLKRYEEGNKNG